MVWKEVKLGDVCKLINGRAYSNEEMLKSGKYKIVRVGNLSGGNSTWFYSDLELPEDKYCNKGDLLFAWACTFGPHIWEEDNTIYHYHIWKVIENKNSIDRKFFYYYLKYATRYFMGAINGSVMVHITKATMEQMSIKIPVALPDQRKISSILSSLDSKIETNNKLNAKLEELAQTIFKSWFVDFEPFKVRADGSAPTMGGSGKMVESELGLIPEGWKVGSIGDYCKVKSGYAFKSSWWTDRGDKIIKIKNITENGSLDLNDCSCVAQENTKKAKEFKAKAGDLIIAMTGATIGKFNIIPKLTDDYYINQRVGKFFLGDEPLEKLPFIYSLLKQPFITEQIVNKGKGSAQPNISGGDIESIKIAFNEEVISNFNNKFKTLFNKLITNQQENQRLASLRDTLLPKLMSGEIEI